MLFKGFELIRLSSETNILPFNCGNTDLNGFLFDDAKNYANELLATTFIIQSDTETVAYFNYLNDKINFPQSDNWNGSKLIIEDAHVNIPVVLNKIDSLVLKGDYLIVEDSDDKQKDLISFLNTTANKYLADQHYLDLFGRNGTSAINSIFRVF